MSKRSSAVTETALHIRTIKYTIYVLGYNALLICFYQGLQAD